MQNKHFQKAFSLAETLLALMIIGILALVVLPSLYSNIQSIIFKERSKNILYKLSQATDRMKVDGMLDTKYADTSEFVNELAKYLKIVKRCEGSNVQNCFNASFITDAKDKKIMTANLITGQRLGHNSWSSDNVGLILADGAQLILSYNTDDCKPLSDGGLVTYGDTISSTLGCLAIVYDVNGDKGPNTLNKDICTQNAVVSNAGFRVGETDLYIEAPASGYEPVSKEYCEANKERFGVANCCSEEDCPNGDYWLGALKYCDDLGLKPLDKNNAGILAEQLFQGSTTIKDQELFDFLQGKHPSFTFWAYANQNSSYTGVNATYREDYTYPVYFQNMTCYRKNTTLKILCTH